jgi:hypothetical protein
MDHTIATRLGLCRLIIAKKQFYANALQKGMERNILKRNKQNASLKKAKCT